MRRLLLLPLSIFVALGCADPEGAYDDFVERKKKTSDNSDAGTGNDGGGACSSDPCSPPAAGAIDGDYLFSLAAIVNGEATTKKKPFVFVNTVTTKAGSPLEMSWSLQPLNKDDRKTAVGTPIDIPSIQIDNEGLATISLKDVNLPGEANPISGSIIVADLEMSGRICDGAADFFAGQASGQASKPLPLPIDKGSEWMMEKITDPNNYPSPVIDCQKTAAPAP